MPNPRQNSIYHNAANVSGAVHGITANHLVDGAVVYLTERDGWSRNFEDCRTIGDKIVAAALLRRAEQKAVDDLIVGPYLFKIAQVDGRPVPLGRREILRTTGPSVGTDLQLG